MKKWKKDVCILNCMEAIYNELADYSSAKMKSANKIIDLLKEDCNTYLDLEEKINQMTKTMIWDGSEFLKSDIVSYIKSLIEEEKNGLHIADRK